jgi:hypothetical protein
MKPEQKCSGFLFFDLKYAFIFTLIIVKFHPENSL